MEHERAVRGVTIALRAPEQLQLVRGHERACEHCAGIGVLDAFDGFAGAGGSSLGLEAVCCHWCGRSLIRVVAALNHDPLAVEAHNTNFPHADHDVHDIQEVSPARFPWTPLAWFSPDCGHHAYCRGKRNVDEDGRRARMTFFDIERFAAYHRYHAVIVENVIEARLWCDTLGHPDKCNCGSHFDAWFASMEQLGYTGQIVYFNSQFALPTPQSRDRMYIVWTLNGIQLPNLDFRPISWCSTCESVVRGIQSWKPPSGKKSVRLQPGKFRYGRYGTQYLYRCPDCTSPVAPAVTGARSIIDPTLPITRIGDRAEDLAPNTRERIKYGWERIQNLEPIVVQVGGHLYERRKGVRVWSIDAPLRTVHATADRGIVVRVGGQSPAPSGLDEPTQTITAHDRQIGLVIPNMEHNVGKTIAEPIGAVTSGNRHMLVQVNRGKPGDRPPTALDEPSRTIAGHGELALVSFRNHGDAAPVDVPAHTVVAGGLHHGLLVYNGNPGFVQPLDVATGTLTARDKQSLLVPYYSTGVAHPTAEPMGTVTSKDRQALVITDADINDCYFRMLQWPELLKAQQMHVHGDGTPYRLSARRRDKRTGKFKELSNEQRVKMIGMAVSSPVATMLGHAVVDVLAVA